MNGFNCGDRIRNGNFPPGASGCLVQFPEFPEKLLMLVAGHVVLTSFARPGDAIYDDETGDFIGRLFAWTAIDGDPTADAALVWVDPDLVGPELTALGTAADINANPAVGDILRIVPQAGQAMPREAIIRAVDTDVDIVVVGPGWDVAPTIRYRGQIVCDRLFTESGDSGAIALDARQCVVGMVVAGSSEVGTVITPIAAILDNLAWGERQLMLANSISTAMVAPEAPNVSLPESTPAHPTPASAGFELGQLSQQFESNGKPGAIGFDTKGGFSYGAYQIAARPGTLDKFLRFLDDQFADFSQVLQAAGGSAAGRDGDAAFKEAWQRLALDPLFFQAQHQFIEATHYTPFVQHLLAELQLNVAAGSRVLRDVAWSVAVQHGSANRVFANALAGRTASAMPDRDIIVAVYAERSNVTKYFPSSTAKVDTALRSRFQSELAMALDRLAAEV